MTDVATTERPGAQQSPAQRQKRRLDGFMDALTKRQESLSTLLSDSGVSPGRFLEVARRALSADPDLLHCTPDSLLRAFVNCATDGLVPDGRKAAITSYVMKRGTTAEHRVAQYMPMAQGLLEIAYRSERFLSIEARVVYRRDEFDYDLGDSPFIKHKPSAEAVANRQITAAYSIARAVNGGVFREVMVRADLDKVRAVSRATSGPNKDWPEEMARKAPLRRLWKYLPKTLAMERVLEHDNETYDLAGLPAAAPEPKRLAPGFQAVQHQPADEVPMVVPDLDAVLHGDQVPAFTAATENDAAELPDDGDAAEWASGFARALPDFDSEAALDTALHEPLNARLIAALEGGDPGLHRALLDGIEDRRRALRAAAVSALPLTTGRELLEKQAAPPSGDSDPVDWALSVMRSLDNLSAGDIRALLDNPTNQERYAALQARSGDMAKQLDEAIATRERALAQEGGARG